MQRHRLMPIVLFCLLSGCVSELPIDEESVSVPVLNCVLTNDSVQTLRLTRSVRISDYYVFKSIDGAIISLTACDSLVGQFVQTANGDWLLTYLPVPDTEYTVRAELPDGTVLSAATTMPHDLDIRQLTDADHYPTKNFVQYGGDRPCWVTVIAADRLLLASSRPVSTDNMKEVIGTDHPNADRFNDYGNLLDMLPTADTPAYLFYIRLKADSTIYGSTDIPFRIQTNYENHTFVCFRTASNEYDAYVKTSLQKAWYRLDVTDPIIWFDESSVYSNIKNGKGIFAAFSDQCCNYNDDEIYF